MKADVAGLPSVHPDISAHSRAFVDLLRNRIMGGGPVSFADYMQAALYEPGFGYYVAGLQKFGEHGDFTTAPESSRLFGACLAEQCTEVLQALASKPKKSILEFGAGSGKLARDILTTLSSLGCLPDEYLILEPSVELQARQRETLSSLPQALCSRVRWLDRLPLAIDGIVLANEVLDAMPVERFVMARSDSSELVPRQICVGLDPADESASALMDVVGGSPTSLVEAVAQITATVADSLIEGYQSELNLNIGPWLSGVSASLASGALLLIDYGHTRREYYLPERSSGTLMCYLKQHAHSDPYYLPAAQDLTAHVDFSHVVEAAVEAGLELNGFCSQSAFLRANSLLAHADSLMADWVRSESAPDPSSAANATLQKLKIAAETKTLTMPDQMGERFAVMGLSKGLDFALRGFAAEDWSHRL